MAAGFTENLHQQIRCAVDHRRLLHESGGGRHMTDHTHDPSHTVQRTEFLFHDRQGVHERQPRGFGSAFHRYLLPQLPGDRHLAVAKRQDTAQIQQITGKHRRHITGNRLRRNRKREAQAA